MRVAKRDPKTDVHDVLAGFDHCVVEALIEWPVEFQLFLCKFGKAAL